jgi:hypothetical protein
MRIRCGDALPTIRFLVTVRYAPRPLNRSELASPFEEVAHDARFGFVRPDVLRVDQDNAVAVGQRNRW